MTIRKVSVVTGTRAEYGIIKPLMEKINKSKHMELNLIVTGMHLLKKHGLTIKEIINDGFEVGNIVRMYNNDERTIARYMGNKKNAITYYSDALARGISGFSDVLSNNKPDILVVFGDRLEQFAAVLAAATIGIPIAHIHGGDKTDSGHIDESIRHAISRFAHIHFTAISEHTNRLIKFGEESWRIFEVGALELDSVVGREIIPKHDLSGKIGFNIENETIVCIFHPIHLEKELAGKQMREILNAIKKLEMQTVIIYPNNDAGSEYIIEEIEKCRKLPYIKIFSNLPHNEYINLIDYATVLIGNSSSGIIEAPSLKTPVVNIGSRNVGRSHANNIIFVDTEKNKIINSIRKVLYDENFKDEVKRCINPYGDGKTSDRIIEILSTITIDKNLLRKTITQ